MHFFHNLSPIFVFPLVLSRSQAFRKCKPKRRCPCSTMPERRNKKQKSVSPFPQEISLKTTKIVLPMPLFFSPIDLWDSSFWMKEKKKREKEQGPPSFFVDLSFPTSHFSPKVCEDLLPISILTFFVFLAPSWSPPVDCLRVQHGISARKAMRSQNARKEQQELQSSKKSTNRAHCNYNGRDSTGAN